MLTGYLPAIKYLKEVSDCGLKEAKETVDRWKGEWKEDTFKSELEILTEKNRVLTEALEYIVKDLEWNKMWGSTMYTIAKEALSKVKWYFNFFLPKRFII